MQFIKIARFIFCFSWLIACSPVERDVITWKETELENNHPIYCQNEQVFPLELYSLKDSISFAFAEKMGFNAVIGHEHNLEKLCLAFDFMLTDAHWLQKAKDSIHLIKQGTRFLPKLKLLAHNLNDEPDLRRHLVSTDFLTRSADAFRKTFPDRKTSITLAGVEDCQHYWSEYNACADIIRVDPYPLIEDLPFSFVDTLMLAAAKMSNDKKPILAVLQAWTWGGGPFPNEREICHMAIRSLLLGANGLSYFDWNPALWGRYPAYFNAVARLNFCITNLMKSCLLAGQRFVLKQEENILLRQWKSEKEVLILATNSSLDKNQKIKLQLPAIEGKYYIYQLPSFEKKVIKGKAYDLELEPLAALIISTQNKNIPDFMAVIDTLKSHYPMSVPSPPIAETKISKPIVLTKIAAPFSKMEKGWASLPDSVMGNSERINEPVKYQFKLAVSEDKLYWGMQAACQHRIRKESVKGMRYYVGDDVARLFYSDSTGQRRLLQINSNGLIRVYDDEKDQIGNEMILDEIFVQKSDTAWHFMLACSLKLLGIQAVQAASFNLGYGFSIAPKQRLFYNIEERN